MSVRYHIESVFSRLFQEWTKGCTEYETKMLQCLDKIKSRSKVSLYVAENLRDFKMFGFKTIVKEET